MYIYVQNYIIYNMYYLYYIYINNDANSNNRRKMHLKT